MTIVVCEKCGKAGLVACDHVADTYRGWSIARGRWPEPAWVAVGPNYDASYEGPEDGWVSNGEHVTAATRKELLAEIDRWHEENAE